jgi:hypothetical protein
MALTHVEDRRKQVAHRYFFMRQTQKTIAQELQWDERTIWNDIAWLREQWIKNAKEHSADYLIRYLERKEILISTTLVQLSTSDSKERREVIKTLRELDNDVINILFRAGVLKEIIQPLISFQQNNLTITAEVERIRKALEDVNENNRSIAAQETKSRIQPQKPV